MKKRIALLMFAVLLFVFPAAPAGIHAIKITGVSATVPLSATALSASWIQVLAPSGNSAAVNLGDSTTSSTVGFPLAAGSGEMLPVRAGRPYTLSSVYVYVATGDTVRVLWADGR